MNNSKDNKENALNYFGKCVIEEVYDRALFGAKRIVKQTTPNRMDLERYDVFSELSQEQQEKVCDLLTETVMDTIYRFLEMVEEHDDEFKLFVEMNKVGYSLTDISEKIGSEIADLDDGWINQFSQI